MLQSTYSLKHSRSPRRSQYIFQRWASDARQAKGIWWYMFFQSQIPKPQQWEFCGRRNTSNTDHRCVDRSRYNPCTSATEVKDRIAVYGEYSTTRDCSIVP